LLNTKPLKKKRGQIIIQCMLQKLATSFTPKQIASNNQWHTIKTDGGSW